MKKAVTFISLMLLSGCAEMSKLKISDDGRYIFQNSSLSVEAPKECILDMFVYGTESSVTFTTGRGYWMASGVYALHNFRLPNDVSDTDDFHVESEKVYKKVVKDNNRTIIETKTLNISGQDAYQGVSTDNNEDYQVHTHIYMPNKSIALAVLKYPLKNLEGKDTEIPWNCYNRFINSISF
ncbi:hypothetical protein NF212_06605 [Parasalinivibrio latis]|uniref:hypothetical protein n=1 Tax=Parasalinivibrio latis TaxID=2952610 RepID=UPI0030E2E71B